MEFEILWQNYNNTINLPLRIIDKYLKTASGNDLKVLIYIFYSEAHSYTIENISENTAISCENVKKSLLFWEKENVFTLPEKNFDSIKTPDFEITDVLQEKVVEKVVEYKKITNVRYSPKDIENRVKEEDELRYLLQSLQQIYKRPINYKEQCSFINFYEFYRMPINVILLLTDFCVSAGKESVYYIEKIIADWTENSINTYELAENEIIKMTDRTTFENKVKSALSLHFNLTPKQKNMIEKWNNLNISLDMIVFASEKCIDQNNKISFPYIDKILLNWAELAYKKREDVPVNSSHKKKKEESENSYNLDEFYNFAINNNPQFADNK